MPRRYTPAASRTARVCAAWSVSGIVPISFAAGWLGGLDGRTAAAFGLTGLVSAVLAWLLLSSFRYHARVARTIRGVGL